MAEPLTKSEAQTLLDLVRRCIVIYSPILKLLKKPLLYEQLLFFEKALELETAEGFRNLDRQELYLLLVMTDAAIEEKLMNLSPWHDSEYEDLTALKRKLREIINY